MLPSTVYADFDSPCSFRGAGATGFLEWLTPSSLGSLANHASTLSVLLLPTGGIIDDTVITKHSPDQYYVVTNAGRRDEDLSWFAEKLQEWNAKHSDKVEHEILENWGLVALQGPKAADYLQGFVDSTGGKSFDLKQLTFGKSAWLGIGGVNVHVARGGYTGEDGFEVSWFAFLVPSPNSISDFSSAIGNRRLDPQNPQVSGAIGRTGCTRQSSS